MFLEGLTICVNFHDYLVRTLPKNKKHFDNFIVVTTPEDHRTQKICALQNVPVKLSFRKGPKFNKGALINDGLSVMGKTSWIIHVDADVLLPETLRSELEKCHLDQDTFYGARLLIATNPQDLSKTELIHSYRCIGIGAFQLWHAQSKYLKNQKTWYSEKYDHAGRSDRKFYRLWNKQEPTELEGIHPIHLGELRLEKFGGHGEDWSGRQDTHTPVPIAWQEVYTLWEKTSSAAILEEPLESKPEAQSPTPPHELVLELPTMDYPFKPSRLAPRVDELEWLRTLLLSQRGQIKSVLELGCGISTWVIQKALKPRVYIAVEDFEQSVKDVKSILPKLDIQDSWEYGDAKFDFLFLDSSAGYGSDGLHREKALIAAEPSLCDNALVIVHDWNKRSGKASRAYVENNKQYTLLEEFRGRTGMAALRFIQKAGTEEFITDYSNITLSATVTDDTFFQRAGRAIQSFVEQKKWNGPLLIIGVNFKTRERHKNIRFEPLEINGENTRQCAIGAMVFGGAKFSETAYNFKIDCDCHAVEKQPFLTASQLNCEMAAQKWGYTRGFMMAMAHYWIDGLWKAGRIKHGEFTGVEKSYPMQGDPKKPHRLKYKCARIASGWGRLAKTSLLQEIVACHDFNRLAIPSEDTILSAWCDRLGLPWERTNWKSRGIKHSKGFYKEG